MSNERIKYHNHFSSTKCVVTGGEGFIGTHLVESLLGYGAHVLVIDNYCYGQESYLSRDPHARLEVIDLDITDQPKTTEVIADNKPEFVFHLATVNLATANQSPTRDAKVTIGGMLNLLFSISLYNQETTVINSSTGSVYGNPVLTPQTESHPLNPVSSYGVSKLAAEHYLRVWGQEYGIPWTTLRYYNVFGPRNDNGVVTLFINQIFHDQPITIHGTGEQTRCLTYVDDVVRATLLAAMESRSRQQAINIASPERISILDLAQIIMSMMNHAVDFIYSGRRQGDIDHFAPSTELAKQLLGFEAATTLIEGLEKTIEWFSNQE